MWPKARLVSENFYMPLHLYCTFTVHTERMQRICSLKPQWLLEAKIGKYKLYDKSFLTLIPKDEWVTDEVRKYFNITAKLYFTYRWYLYISMLWWFAIIWYDTYNNIHVIYFLHVWMIWFSETKYFCNYSKKR